MDIEVMYCFIFILSWLQSVWGNTKVSLNAQSGCGKGSNAIILSNGDNAVTWPGTNLDNCMVSFDRKSSDVMICVKVTEYTLSTCNHRIGYYKSVTSGAPIKSISCDATIGSTWCCSADKVNVKISGVGSGSISFQGYPEPYDVKKDECSNTALIVTPRPLPEGVLNIQALTKKICNTNIMTLVDSKPDVYQWSAATVPSCLVGYHHVGASGRSICMCVETVDYTFHDCEFKIQYFGESLTEGAKQTIDCNQKTMKWCTDQSTINIKLQAPENYNDTFVFKLYAKPTEGKCLIPISSASLTQVNVLVVVVVSLLAMV